MSETDPLGINTPLIELIESSIDDLGILPPMRHEAPVLNAQVPNEIAARFLGLATCGALEIAKVKWTEHEVAADLRAFTVLVQGQIKHMDKNETAGEFNDWYIGEELHGGSPFLLLKPERVTRHERKLSGGEELFLRFMQRE